MTRRRYRKTYIPPERQENQTRIWFLIIYGLLTGTLLATIALTILKVMT